METVRGLLILLAAAAIVAIATGVLGQSRRAQLPASLNVVAKPNDSIHGWLAKGETKNRRLGTAPEPGQARLALPRYPA